jgi:uncharacterized protein (DUF1810 family)
MSRHSEESDPFELERFTKAQEQVYARALSELADGAKRSHWMWFIFPQMLGLGHSPMARRYAIRSAREAACYLAHPLLGKRLVECTRAVNQVSGRTIHQIFGNPDDMKFHSSMTLFNAVAEDSNEFAFALEKYFDGRRDEKTLSLIAGG